MPYYRRRYRRRRYGGYRRRYGGGAKRRSTKLQRLTNDKSASKITAGSVASAAFTALSLANKFKGLINVEKKHHDVELSTNAVSTTPQINLLTGIAQGDTNLTRTGNDILMKTLEMKFKITQHASATRYTTVTGWLICDKRCDGTLPGYTDIFDDPTSTSDRVIAMRNDDNLERFVVIKKWRWLLTESGREVSVTDEFVKLDIHCRYDGTGSTIADGKDNQLYLVLVSDEPANTPLVEVISRLRFIDN